ncbi:BspA family leucine-rich repeat surface protein [Flagellimonas onchidii]|uniref:BspA family leucine-rich repeat surface protein n=1 Tax=Flagellimonas onchidii TaxID=2562684 RepID=UPI0010A635C5|nr:BspA family leucine-rich repeat surface protein [Allomuricauda onchidii]
MKKIANLALYLLSGTLLFLACSKDDPDKPTPVEEENTAPVIKAQTFTVMEDATVDASDEDGDQLTFSITVNDNALFAIDNTGKITLAEGKALDFDTTPSHTITVQVEDKEDKASAQMTINLTDTNDIAPVFEEEGYNFEAFEDIAQDVVMGTVAGSDPEGAPVTYKITADENELFAIDGNTGEITLAAGKQLDFEAFEGSEPVHNIVVQISDGELTAEVNVAITVKNIVETLAEDPNSFVTTWETTGANESIDIGIHHDIYEYNFTVDWGDGTVQELNFTDQNSFFHSYEAPGTYTVAISGDFPGLLAYIGDEDKLKSIEQWGSIEWQSMSRAFRGCTNMVYNAKDIPNLSQVDIFSEMFRGCSNFNGDLSGWNLNQNIIFMIGMFSEASSFEGIGLETWNTQNATSMEKMFRNAAKFNADISGWNTGKVSSMESMFNGAIAFNGDIGDWKTQNVTTMQNMFTGATAFDQNLGNWDISSVTNMENMLNNTAMSNENYGNTLIGWATLDEDAGETQIPINISLGPMDLSIVCLA